MNDHTSSEETKMPTLEEMGLPTPEEVERHLSDPKVQERMWRNQEKLTEKFKKLDESIRVTPEQLRRPMADYIAPGNRSRW